LEWLVHVHVAFQKEQFYVYKKAFLEGLKEGIMIGNNNNRVSNED
jgi:hypothetical protein